ncbi:unnamed protein product [Amoebophrya sp. A25]|nr:unnamed protein product [Amoebophrya sp. A25]|eukprot:GSA25T00001945001.1
MSCLWFLGAAEICQQPLTVLEPRYVRCLANCGQAAPSGPSRPSGDVGIHNNREKRILAVAAVEDAHQDLERGLEDGGRPLDAKSVVVVGNRGHRRRDEDRDELQAQETPEGVLRRASGDRELAMIESAENVKKPMEDADTKIRRSRDARDDVLEPKIDQANRILSRDGLGKDFATEAQTAARSSGFRYMERDLGRSIMEDPNQESGTRVSSTTTGAPTVALSTTSTSLPPSSSLSTGSSGGPGPQASTAASNSASSPNGAGATSTTATSPRPASVLTGMQHDPEPFSSGRTSTTWSPFADAATTSYYMHFSQIPCGGRSVWVGDIDDYSRRKRRRITTGGESYQEVGVTRRLPVQGGAKENSGVMTSAITSGGSIDGTEDFMLTNPNRRFLVAEEVGGTVKTDSVAEGAAPLARGGLQQGKENRGIVLDQDDAPVEDGTGFSGIVQENLSIQEDYTNDHSTADNDDSASDSLRDLKGETRLVYDFFVPTKSLVTTFNLVCERRHYVQTIAFAYFFGFLVALAAIPRIADAFGRRPALYTTLVIHQLAATSACFVSSVDGYSLARFFLGLGNGGLGMVAWLLLTEILPLENRRLQIIVMNCMFALGAIFVSMVSLAFANDWKAVTILLALLSWFSVLLPMLPLLESARWYLARGRLEECKTVLIQVARINGKGDYNPYYRPSLISYELPSGVEDGDTFEIGSASDDEERAGTSTKDKKTAGVAHPRRKPVDENRVVGVPIGNILANDADVAQGMARGSSEKDRGRRAGLQLERQAINTPPRAEERLRPTSADTNTSTAGPPAMQPLDDSGKAKAEPSVWLHPTMRSWLAALSFAWFAVQLGYWGIAFSVENLSLPRDDRLAVHNSKPHPQVIAVVHQDEKRYTYSETEVYWTAVKAYLVEFPATLVAAYLPDLRLVGRRGASSASLILGGIAMLTACFAQLLTDMDGFALGCALLGRFFATVAFAVLYTLGAEAFPTEIRGTAFGWQSLSARVAGLLIPYIVALDKHWFFGATLLILAGPMIGAGVKVRQHCPETQGEKMVDTVAELDRLMTTRRSGKDQPHRSPASSPYSGVLSRDDDAGIVDNARGHHLSPRQMDNGRSGNRSGVADSNGDHSAHTL